MKSPSSKDHGGHKVLCSRSSIEHAYPQFYNVDGKVFPGAITRESYDRMHRGTCSVCLEQMKFELGQFSERLFDLLTGRV
jgi:hypothetical protein